jgi:hypothetical protein
MKKSVAIFAGVTAVMLVLQSWASNPGVTGTFTVHTAGPDKYADGTTVLAGETYLLVYVAAGSVFGGVYQNGAVSDGSVVAASFKADKNSSCPYSPVVYPTDKYPEGGKWALVLLDTRKADGTVGGPVAAFSEFEFAPQGTVAKNSVKGIAGQQATANAVNLLSGDSVTPVIASVKVEESNVKLGIKNFQEGVNYEVVTATSLNGEWTAVKEGVAGRLQANAQNVVGDELKTEVPVAENEKARFYRVVVPGTVK